MLYAYRILINLIILLSPIILIIRLLKKKEDFFRFKEKFCFFSKIRKKGNLIWFHGASVGELKSIIPILEKIEKNSKIQQVLITSNTLSSAKILEHYKFKKIVHQFFPIDNDYLCKKFLIYWKPTSAFFIDSEIWPNMNSNLKRKNIPIILLNARITKKTFRRWSSFQSFSEQIFSKFNLCLSSSKESKIYLKKLGAKNIKSIGNLKFTQIEDEKISINNKLKKFIQSKKVWCASSTHETEEILCAKVHKELKKKYSNLLTIIIPRHVERANSIIESLKEFNLKIHTHKPKKNINRNTDIYIVNSYGETKSFYMSCKNIFLGGSLIVHGGQNPLEPSRFGCNIVHGPSIYNFKEIYQFLKENKISTMIKNQKELTYTINGFFNKTTNKKIIQKKLNLIGKNILKITYKEIKIFF
tara:strand:- start:585 stop:1826 length:1242 start_codon:yes stop_codon:yes gene_type:complete